MSDKITTPSFWSSGEFLIYSSHVVSAWGDRMWSFALGLYWVILYPDSLQLSAIHGFAICTTVIIFGVLLGKWIDNTRRITAAQSTLIVQNTSILICSILLTVLLNYQAEIDMLWGGYLRITILAIIIIIDLIGNLGTEANKLALEKDWIVVIADGDEQRLSKMNSTMRSIDLSTYILAPVLVGQIITFTSKITGALFIAGWNVISGALVYYLQARLYHGVPKLAQKQIPVFEEKYLDVDFGDKSNLLGESVSVGTYSTFPVSADAVHKDSNSNARIKQLLLRLKSEIKDFWTGWKDYWRNPVRNAGLGLAMLYMTVLGFDNITNGYAYSQGVSESLLSIMTAVGAGFGLLGSIAFPFLRKLFGKLITGHLGFGLETACLFMCVVSIFTPGSQFAYWDIFSTSFNDTSVVGSLHVNVTSMTNVSSQESLSLPDLFDTRISVLILMFGIITARFGLWVADLSVTQVFQEEVPEDQRGTVNGVQGSMNQTMNLLKYILVIILPNPATYAYLILLSWLFVVLGWLFFGVYSYQEVRKSRQLNQTGNKKSEL